MEPSLTAQQRRRARERKKVERRKQKRNKDRERVNAQQREYRAGANAEHVKSIKYLIGYHFKGEDLVSVEGLNRVVYLRFHANKIAQIASQL